MSVMQNDIKHINEDIGEIKQYIKEDREWKLDVFEKTDKRYTLIKDHKNLKTIVYSTITGVSTFLLGLLGYFIVK